MQTPAAPSGPVDLVGLGHGAGTGTPTGLGGVAAPAADAEARGRAWLAVSFIFCPCHVPLALSALASVLAGTAVGALVSAYLLPLGIAVSVLWAALVFRGFMHLRKAKALGACQTRRPSLRRATAVPST